MDIKDVRKALGISNTWIARKLGFRNVKAYNNSSAKKRYESFIVELYKKFKEDEI